MEEVPEWTKTKKEQKLFETIKDRISSKKQRTRSLYRGETDIESLTNMVFVSNHKYIMPIALKTERKLNPQWCGKVENEAYFDTLLMDLGVKQEGDPELTPEQKNKANSIAEHFFHLVMQQDISQFKSKHFMNHKSELRKKLEMESVPGDVAFMMWFITHLLKDVVPINKTLRLKHLYKVSEIYDLYKEFSREYGFPLKHKHFNVFSSKMNELLTWWSDTKVKKKKGNFYDTSNYINVGEANIKAQISTWNDMYRFCDKQMAWTPDDRIDPNGCNSFVAPKVYKTIVKARNLDEGGGGSKQILD